MPKLNNETIERLASVPGARRMAVENFLMTLPETREAAMMNLEMDSSLYHWNDATVGAIWSGIQEAFRPEI